MSEAKAEIWICYSYDRDDKSRCCGQNTTRYVRGDIADRALAAAECFKLELAKANARARPQGWANDPEIAPLKNELARLRQKLEQQERELSNARIDRDAAQTALRVATKGSCT